MRVGREEYFMNIAVAAAERSTCPRARVGAILVDEKNRIVSTGYNGAVKGSPHCDRVGCLMVNEHCVRTLHAELNAVLHLEHQYENLILYCTHQPCYQCLKVLSTVDVREIKYIHTYDDLVRDKIFNEIVGGSPMERYIRMNKVVREEV